MRVWKGPQASGRAGRAQHLLTLVKTQMPHPPHPILGLTAVTPRLCWAQDLCMHCFLSMEHSPPGDNSAYRHPPWGLSDLPPGQSRCPSTGLPSPSPSSSVLPPPASLSASVWLPRPYPPDEAANPRVRVSQVFPVSHVLQHRALIHLFPYSVVIEHLLCARPTEEPSPHLTESG